MKLKVIYFTYIFTHAYTQRICLIYAICQIRMHGPDNDNLIHHLKCDCMFCTGTTGVILVHKPNKMNRSWHTRGGKGKGFLKANPKVIQL